MSVLRWIAVVIGSLWLLSALVTFGICGYWLFHRKGGGRLLFWEGGFLLVLCVVLWPLLLYLVVVFRALGRAVTGAEDMMREVDPAKAPLVRPFALLLGLDALQHALQDDSAPADETPTTAAPTKEERITGWRLFGPALVITATVGALPLLWVTAPKLLRLLVEVNASPLSSLALGGGLFLGFPCLLFTVLLVRSILHAAQSPSPPLEQGVLQVLLGATASGVILGIFLVLTAVPGFWALCLQAVTASPMLRAMVAVTAMLLLGGAGVSAMFLPARRRPAPGS